MSAAGTQFETTSGERSTARLAAVDHFGWELAARGAAITALVASCLLISAGKPFWNDEIMAWKVITDPSLSHMLWALAHACDGAPPGFHLIARAWAGMFGPSVLSLRLFSCAGMCVALLVLWSVLRRYFQFRAVAFGVLTVWCNSTILLTYSSEARNYGLFLAVTALLVAVADRVANRSVPTKAMLAILYGVTTLLIYSHYFGLIYSGCVLLALVSWDVYRRRFRPAVYVSIVVGWLPLLLWAPSIAREQALFNERTYYRGINTNDLLSAYSGYVPAGPLVGFVALCAVTAIVLWRDRHSANSQTSSDKSSFLPLAFTAFFFLTAPLLIYVATSWAHVPFSDRYFLPSAVAFAVLLTILADRVLSMMPGLAIDAPGSVPRRRLLSIAWVALFISIAGGAVLQARNWPFLPVVNSALDGVVPGLPIVIEEQHQWMQATFYDRSPAPRYFYVLDRESAMDPHSAIDEPFFFNERTAWKKAGYWSDRVVPSDEFLCRHDRFGVLASPGRLWFDKRVAQNPAFVVESETSVQGGKFLLVSRKPGAHLPACDTVR